MRAARRRCLAKAPGGRSPARRSASAGPPRPGRRCCRRGAARAARRAPPRAERARGAACSISSASAMRSTPAAVAQSWIVDTRISSAVAREDDRGGPGAVERGSRGERGEAERDARADAREPRPRADPDELAPGAVLLDRDAQPHRAEHAAAHVQVPALVVAAGEDHAADAAQRLLEAPRRARRARATARSRCCVCAAPAVPGAAPSAAARATGRNAGGRRAGRPAGAGRAGRCARAFGSGRTATAGGADGAVHAAHRGLEDECGDRGEQQRQREQERRPQHAQRGEAREARDHEVPLGHQRQRAEDPGRRLVDGLEQPGAPGAVVDLPAAAEQLRGRSAVDAARPGEVAGAVVALGPLALQQRLGLAVLVLLLEVAASSSRGGGARRRRRG